MIISTNFIGSPLILDLYLALASILSVGLLCIVQIGMHTLSPGSCDSDFFA